MNICIVSEGYPYPGFQQCAFVKQLCNEFADRGHKIIVIAPQSLTNKIIRKNPFIPYHRYEKTQNNNIVEIYTPKYLSLGNLPFLGSNYNFNRINKTVEKTFSRIIKHTHIDLCYGHFWHVGAGIYKSAKKYNIPLFIASGESCININNILPKEKIKEMSDYVTGVICVSTKNKEESIKKCFVSEDKCGVFPNGINDKIFYFKNKKNEIRESKGFSREDFIVSFVGDFSNRKGPSRVAEAIQKLHDSSIKSIFIGGNNGETKPVCNGILHAGPMEHNLIPDYLNCSDVYVIPTLAEGCCNSIIEAMACGLPIISSDRSFNYDIIDKENSIMIDPMDVDAIANSIKYLKENPEKLKKMSESSLEKAKHLTISIRITNLLNFIDNKLNMN